VSVKNHDLPHVPLLVHASGTTHRAFELGNLGRPCFLYLIDRKWEVNDLTSNQAVIAQDSRFRASNCTGGDEGMMLE